MELHNFTFLGFTETELHDMIVFYKYNTYDRLIIEIAKLKKEIMELKKELNKGE